MKGNKNMILLAVDTSNKIASVSVFDNNELLGEKINEDEKTHSEKLLPLIDKLLKEVRLEINDIDLFSVCVGPGSFTGIRIGVATIKGIAQALNKKVIPVTSLEALIGSSKNENVCAIIDAKHGNIYEQIKYKGTTNIPDFMTVSQFINHLKSLDEKFEILGELTEEFTNLLNPENYFMVSVKKNETSSDIGKVALDKYLKDSNAAKNPHEILPIYLRKAQPDRGA